MSDILDGWGVRTLAESPAGQFGVEAHCRLDGLLDISPLTHQQPAPPDAVHLDSDADRFGALQEPGQT